MTGQATQRRSPEGGDSSRSARPNSRALRLAIVPIVALTLAGGFYLIGGQLVEGKAGFWVGLAWWLLVGAAFVAFALRRRELLVPVAATIVVVSGAAAIGGYISSRESVVHEPVAMGAAAADPQGGGEGGSGGGGADGGDGQTAARDQDVQIAEGTVSGVSGHEGTGEAAVVELASGGRVLTFTEFDIDPGAGDVRVYLAADDPQSDDEVQDFVDLGDLKGSQGDQQYEIPESVDLDRYDSVVVWCIPFTTRLAQASL